MNRRWAKIAPSIAPNGDIDVDTLLKLFDDDIAQMTSGVDEMLGLKSSKATTIYKSGDKEQAVKSQGPLDNADSDDDGPEVMLTHEIDNSETVAIEGLTKDFHTLDSQLVEFRSRFEKTAEKMRELQQKVIELEETNETLEEEIQKLMSLQPVERVESMPIAKVQQRRTGSKTENIHSRGAEIRKALLIVDDSFEFTISMDNFLQNDFWKLAWTWINNRLPFKKEIRQLEARFGSSIVSYFFFYRFVFLQFLGMAAITAVFLYFHVSRMIQLHGWKVLFTMHGTGYLPYFMTFSSYTPEEALQYSLLVVIQLVLLTVSVVDKIVREDRIAKELDAMEKENESPYAKEVFCSWDFAMTSKQEAETYSGSLVQTCMLLLDETRMKGIKKARTNLALGLLYIRRIIAGIVYAAVQFAAVYAIFELSISTTVRSKIQRVPLLQHLSKFLAPLAVNMINTIMPTVLGVITNFEAWDEAYTVVNILLFRMYTSNIINNVILAASYILLANPFLLADSSSRFAIRNQLVQQSSTSSEACLIDQASNSLFLLSLSTFASSLFFFAIAPFRAFVISKLMKADYVKPEFDVAGAMVDVFSFVSVLMLITPFSALFVMAAPIYIYITIKWQAFWLLRSYAKPKRPWKAQKSGAVFTGFYLATLATIGIPVAVYFLTSGTFPKSCDIQDAHVHLCGTAVGPDDQCATSPSSAYYGAYGHTNYPAAICAYKCGPFVDQANGFAPLRSAILAVPALRVIWIALFEYPYLPWAALSFLFVVTAHLISTLQVHRASAENKERDMEAHIKALEGDKAKLEKKLARHAYINITARGEPPQQPYGTNK